MNLKKYIFALTTGILLATPLWAKEKPFYDSKSNIVCITGDYEQLKFGNKFIKVGVELPDDIKSYATKPSKEALNYLNKCNLGKKILDYLFCYDGSSLSEDRLKDLALKNVLKSDDERATIGVMSKEDILKEDYLPILENNYIFVLTYIDKKYYWNVYKAEINKDILDQVFNCWNDMDKYNQIKVPISFVSSGNSKKGMNNKTRRKIAIKVPAFAIRGKVTGRHPFTTDLGAIYGLQNRDKVAIYRTKEKKGKKYSSKVCTTRACNVADNTAFLYTFAGGQASYKKGDVAVYQPSSNSSISVTGEYMDHSYGIGLTYDKRLSLSRIGLSQYFIMKLGGGAYEKFGKRLYATNTGDVVKSPICMNFGMGYGVGYEFAHCLEIEPYLLAQWEGLYFAIKYKHETNYTSSAYNDKKSEDVLTNAIRVPIGVKLNMNIIYPLQLMVGAEYIFNFNLGRNEENDNTVSNAKRFFFDPTGYKRSGLNVFAGLRFNF